MSSNEPADLARSALAEICECLPIFPLPGVVLMPGSVLPLHVFEPRYRKLVAHCMASDRVLGIATLRPGFEADYDGCPPVYPEVGIGLIVNHQPLEDGRSNLMIEYVARGVVLDEIASDEVYRTVRAQLLEDGTRSAEGAIQRLRALILQLAAVRPPVRAEAERLAGMQASEMVDELARRMLDTSSERRGYLRLDELADRASLVTERLGRALSTEGTPAAEA